MGIGSGRVWSPENRAVAVLCLGGGVAALDAQALFYLSPFVMRDLAITNTEIGALSAAVLVTWALSGFVTSLLADQLGGRKRWVIGALLCFGAFSFASGLAGSFLVLLLARLLIGFAEGPIVPLSLSIVIEESSPHRRGINMGIVQSFGSQLVGSAIAPVILVWLATLFTWRDAFFLAGAPGIAVALLIGFLVREPDRHPVKQPALRLAGRARAQIRGLLRERNVRLCAVCSCFLNAWYFGLLTFLPLYLTRGIHLSPRTMSVVMAVAGVGAVLSAVIVPWISDRFGRRPVMTLFSIVAAVGPLGALWLHDSLMALMVAVFIGAWAQGVLPLCIGTVPMESAPNRDAAAPGMMLLIGMIVGGIMGPAAFGWLADRYGLAVPLWGCAIAALVAAAICSRLDETAPAVRLRLGMASDSMKR
jgi:ACS family hexuronate transporter-like MFS transporter